MHVTVDYDKCQNHGQCVYAAPDVFRLDDAGDLAYDSDPDDGQIDAVEDAADVCPVQAISIA